MTQESRANDVDAVMPIVYQQLRRIAARTLARSAAPETIHPTALVHEVYLRLREAGLASYGDRALIVAAAARAMRNLLADRVRRRLSLKRGGAFRRVYVDLSSLDATAPVIDLLGLEEVLGRLEANDARASQVVTLRFFGGLTIEQVADVLGISTASANRDWRFARAWIRNQFATGEGAAAEASP